MVQAVEKLRRKARECRDLANSAITLEARDVLAELASKYERNAVMAEQAEAAHRRRPAFNWPLT